MPHPTLFVKEMRIFIGDLIYKNNYEIKHSGAQCKIENEMGGRGSPPLQIMSFDLRRK